MHTVVHISDTGANLPLECRKAHEMKAHAAFLTSRRPLAPAPRLPSRPREGGPTRFPVTASLIHFRMGGAGLEPATPCV